MVPGGGKIAQHNRRREQHGGEATMQVRDLTETECQEVLQRLNLGRIACAKDNQPYVVPAYFYLDGRYLYSFGTLGQKIEWMRANPRVCVEVDETIDVSHWTTVLAYGYYEELPDTPEHSEARQRALALFQTRRAWWTPAAAKRGAREHHVPIVYRISITRLTGRRTSSVDSGSSVESGS
jgi:uncharacterized protein